MPTLPIYQVDAFADRPFEGNPAAVVPLDAWPADAVLQAIAQENNLSETAFVGPSDDPDADYRLRWCTPTVEVRLCGHATLAAAHTLFTHLGVASPSIRFITWAGMLEVSKHGDVIEMRFPALTLDERPDLMDKVSSAIGAPVAMAYTSEVPINADGVVVARLDSAESVAALTPDVTACRAIEGGCICVTAPCDSMVGGPADFVSRFFCPGVGIDEDPVTGSNHCALVPLWAGVLGSETLTARQCSARGGVLACRLDGDSVVIGGRAADYLRGEITIP